MNRAARIVAVLAVALAMVGAAAFARAHAVLLEASPADGAVLAEAPGEVTLHFNETVTPVFVRVLDAAGHDVAAPEPAHAQDQTVRLALPRGLPNGSYVVSYRVVSADTHLVGASLLFAVGPAGTVAFAAHAAGMSMDMGPWGVVSVADRALLDMGFVVAVGGALFVLAFGYSGARRTSLAAAGIAALAAVLALGVEGGMIADAPLAAIARPATWRAGLDAGLGPSVALTLAGLGLVALGLARRHRPRRVLIAIGTAAAAAGYAVTGHVAIAEPRWLTAPALWVHVLCVAFWAGSLVPLFHLLRAGGGGASMVERFGQIAVGVVALLILAGVAMTSVQLNQLSDFVRTDYGERLGLKLCLVVALVSVAAVNRLVLTPALRRGRRRAALWLKRSIALELTLIAAIVVIAATLGEVTPPRALAEQAHAQHRLAASPGYSVQVAQTGLSAFITLDPAKPGLNRLVLDLADEHDAPIAAEAATLSLANRALGIEPSAHALRATGPGIYEIADLAIPATGTWTFSIAALIDDFDKRVVTTEVPIQ